MERATSEEYFCHVAKLSANWPRSYNVTKKGRFCILEVKFGPRNAAELRAAVHDQWRALTQWRIRRLVRSCPRRIRAVVEAEGGSTRY